MKYVSFHYLKNVLLNANTPPKVTAFSLALGVWIAFSPFLGLHFISAIVLVRLFKLNGILLFAGIMIHNPWTMLPIHLSGLLVGEFLTPGGFSSLNQFHLFPWQELSFFSLFGRDFWVENWALLRVFVTPFLLGSLLLSSVFGTLSYHLALRFIKHDGTPAPAPPGNSHG